MRAGSQNYGQFGTGLEAIVSLFSYVNGNNAKLFAATASAIYDATVQSLPSEWVDDSSNFLVADNGDQLFFYPAALPTPVVSGLSGGGWSTEQFATPGGVFLKAVNGLDTPQNFDGASWSTSPAITGVDPTSLSYVWAYKQRLFFIKKDSLSAFYLTAASIGGAAVELPLGGVFTRGGSLLFGATWSVESGSGLSEQCVFVTTEGEVAVYQGTDPSVASTWTKVGVYRIGKPLGPKAFIRAGGDLVIATDIGFVPLSTAVQRDIAALAPAAISYRIETEWNSSVVERTGTQWNCEIWPTKQMVVVALPPITSIMPKMLVANARTGAWGRYTGWNAYCVKMFQDRLFYGTDNGYVVECEVTGADRGAPYTAAVAPLFDPLKTPASLKVSQLVRATLLASASIRPQLSLQSDFTVKLPAAPDAFVSSGANTWGSGVWGTSVWSQPTQKSIYQDWQSVGGRGYAIAPAAQITSAGLVPPDIELVQFDMTYDLGDVVS